MDTQSKVKVIKYMCDNILKDIEQSDSDLFLKLVLKSILEVCNE